MLYVFLLLLVTGTVSGADASGDKIDKFDKLKELGKKIAAFRKEKKYAQIFELSCDAEKKRVSANNAIEMMSTMDKVANIQKVFVVADREILAENNLKYFADLEKLDEARLEFRFLTTVDIGGRKIESSTVQVWRVFYLKERWCIKWQSL